MLKGVSMIVIVRDFDNFEGSLFSLILQFLELVAVFFGSNFIQGAHILPCFEIDASTVGCEEENSVRTTNMTLRSDFDIFL